MKRIIVISIITAMLISVLSICINAAEAGDNFGDVPISENVIIDAVKDSDYEKGLIIECNQILGSLETDTTATAWLLWDTGYLYVYAEIYDTQMIEPDAAVRANAPWDVDSFEVFINETNDSVEVSQNRIDSSGYPTYRIRIPSTATNLIDVKNIEDFTDYFGYASKVISGGYAVEYKIPINVGEGSQLGFQLQVNDLRDTGMAKVIPTAKLSPGSWDSDKYNYITLSSTIATPPEIIIADTIDEAVSIEPDTQEIVPAPQTNDKIMLSVVLFMLAFTSISVILTKSKKLYK